MKIKIASRSSKLALKQVEEFIKTFSIEDFDLIEITTQGDKMSAKGNILFDKANFVSDIEKYLCLLYTSPSPRDVEESRMPSSA